MLYIFGGLPGAGKSTLARKLARELQAVYLRVDTIEQALREMHGPLDGPEGYVIAYGVAEDNLRLGLPVVSDTVNPIEITRAAWRDVGARSGVAFVEIEVICSDAQEHRWRVETRVTDVPGLRLPTWEAVVNRQYEPWERADIVVDTAGRSVAESYGELRAAVLNT